MIVSQIYEHYNPDKGTGLAGFTVQIPSEPFVNHIRFFDKNNHQEKIDELEQLRQQILESLNIIGE